MRGADVVRSGTYPVTQVVHETRQQAAAVCLFGITYTGASSLLGNTAVNTYLVTQAWREYGSLGM